MNAHLGHRAGIVRSAVAAVVLLALAVPAAAASRLPAKRDVVRTKTSVARTLDSEAGADRLRANTLGGFASPLLDTRFSFTAAGKGPAAARQATLERAFQFTPSGHPENRKALTLGVTSRVLTAAVDTSRAAAPVESSWVVPGGIGVDLAVGWRGFAVSGGYSRVDTATPVSLNPARREAVDLGLSYRVRNWKTSLQVGAENGPQLPLSPLSNAAERRYTLELGSAYAVTPTLSLSGGVRYQVTPLATGLIDPNRTDSSVYLGTAFSF